MSWPLRTLIGPGIWALAFAAVYALHGVGCARGWTGIATPVGTLHHLAMLAVWLIALAAGALILWRAPRGRGRAVQIERAGGWIGLVSTLLTLFPVLGLTTCGP